MTSYLAATFKSVQSRRTSDLCALSSLHPRFPAMTWKAYHVSADGPVAPLRRGLPTTADSIGTAPGLWRRSFPDHSCDGGAAAARKSADAQLGSRSDPRCFSRCCFGQRISRSSAVPTLTFAGPAFRPRRLYPEVGRSTLTFTQSNHLARWFAPISDGCHQREYPERCISLRHPRLRWNQGRVPRSRTDRRQCPWAGRKSRRSPPPTTTGPGSLSNYNSEVVNGNFGTRLRRHGARNPSTPFVNGD